jgi:hypothetical protein
MGPPERVVQVPESYTGQYLKPYLRTGAPAAKVRKRA